MSKHTPGPWRKEVIGYTLRVTDAADGEFRDDIAVLGDCRNELHQANARLIVQAPELLEAAKAFMDQTTTSNRSRLRMAIHRAEKES